MLEPGALQDRHQARPRRRHQGAAGAAADGRGDRRAADRRPTSPTTPRFTRRWSLASGNRELIAAYGGSAGRVRAIRFRLHQDDGADQGLAARPRPGRASLRCRQRRRGGGRARPPCLQWLSGPGRDARAGAGREPQAKAEEPVGATMKITKAARPPVSPARWRPRRRCGRSGWSARSTSIPSIASSGQLGGRRADRRQPPSADPAFPGDRDRRRHRRHAPGRSGPTAACLVADAARSRSSSARTRWRPSCSGTRCTGSRCTAARATP